MENLSSLREAFLSLDSGAPAKSVDDFISGVRPRHVLMEPAIVPVGIALYLTLKPVLAMLCRAANTTGKSRTFKAFAFLHNALLCAYSFWTAANVWSLTAVHARKSLTGIYCEADLWDAGLGYWGFLFYLSKYWELVDTFLLIWKQRRPSFLQVYHHAVTILCGYMLQASHAHVMFLFAGLNACVHTVMYAYFGLTVLGLRFRAKNLITLMQMLQFIVGIILATPTFWLRGGSCSTVGEKVAVAGIMAHAAYLTILFGQFYVASYAGKGKAKAA